MGLPVCRGKRISRPTVVSQQKLGRAFILFDWECRSTFAINYMTFSSNMLGLKTGVFTVSDLWVYDKRKLEWERSK